MPNRYSLLAIQLLSYTGLTNRVRLEKRPDMESRQDVEVELEGSRMHRKELRDKLMLPRSNKLRFEKEEAADVSAYLKSAVRGQVTVYYERKLGDLGRYLSHRAMDGSRFTMQTMGRSLRSQLARETYHDVDMVNSHPTLLTQLFERYGIANEKLTDYVSRREERLHEVDGRLWPA